MSFENKNLYALLGNDVEDDSAPQLPVREIVKKTASSKKSDVPPPSADPAKAKKKSKPTGNEGAFKAKPDNKSVAGPSNTPSKHYKKPFDRHSRSDKTDSKKKIKQSWGDSTDREIEGEVEGLEDAVADLETESDAPQEPETPKKSLQDYFAELKLKQSELEGQKALRKANEGAEDKWADAEKIEKQQEAYVQSTTNKKSKAKAQKEKKFLEINAIFADEQPVRDESRSTRGGARGGAKVAPKKSSSSPKPEINDKNFPSL
ncbi:uncharacterized protein CANTADRAFT_269868 [Suhomyces tanzawaensis NRRL Y-17324]|uniref:Hyaluronan/mRNA-binding protein domain-containing protein n=1 Tax=Suhomyces tanzawaensis NRRL Y-17324 TaxID=984487 RepID=A0A1E4SGF6_9ASCO|nr:uncharacterized protein CANTADRAFT_269868 [Suhomyces tanzawaensis NRRL Y-17324]ODV78588.1 hypothetical protein CANTADRAFT_269868 [Suhomyces tanzawaensis NRRL Y-17324]